MSWAVIPSSPFSAAARSPANPCMKTPFRTASSRGRPRPDMAAMVPVSTSPEPAVAIPELPLRLMKTLSSGRPIREWAPFSTIIAPSSLTVACRTAIFCLLISRTDFPVILDISPRWGVRTVGAFLFFMIFKSPATAVIPSPSISTGLFIVFTSSQTSCRVSGSRDNPGPITTISIFSESSIRRLLFARETLPADVSFCGTKTISLPFCAMKDTIDWGAARREYPPPAFRKDKAEK